MKIITLTPLSKPVKATVKIPGSKSYTNRALFIAALSSSKVKILNPLVSDDTKAMIDCLKVLGCKILEKDNYIEVCSNLLTIPNHLYELNANLSGLTMRFLLALSTIIPGTKVLYGQEGLNKRPIEELVSALTQLGAKIEYLKEKGYPPVKITSSKLSQGNIIISGSISSQYLSAILMVSPIIGKINIIIEGKQVSKPFIDMTLDIMEKFGVKVSSLGYKKYIINGKQRYSAKKYNVEGDISSASYFLAIAALTKSTITLRNINPKSKQADVKFIKILENMGNKITYGKNEITIIGKGIKPITVNMEDCPDQIQTLAVLTAFSKGATKISGVANLRIKETDRLFAIKEELKKMDIKTSSAKNVLTIYGGNPKASKIDTYGDHRMAMAFAIAGSKISGIEIKNPDVVNKTFPEFWNKLNSIGIKTNLVNHNIVLIGMRGSGKTTVGKLLAKKLSKKFLELDALIEKRVGMKIPVIVEKKGWSYFRKKESEVAKETALYTDKIVSTGGGVVTKDDNIKALKKNGVFIFLNASTKTLLKRIGVDSTRPFLTNAKSRQEDVENVLKERMKLYKRTANYLIDTDNLTPMKIVDQIIKEIL